METANLNNLKRLESVEAFKSKIKGWILKRTIHAKFVNHISTKWVLYRCISIGFNLFIYLFSSIRGNRIAS